MSDTTRGFNIDATRCSRTKVSDFQTAVWVAVCSPDRSKLEGPEPRQAAINWAQTRYKITGAIDQVQGPVDDDGTTLPFDPGPDAPADSGVVGVDVYRQMAARLNVAKAVGGPSGRHVLFVRVLANAF